MPSSTTNQPFSTSKASGTRKARHFGCFVLDMLLLCLAERGAAAPVKALCRHIKSVTQIHRAVSSMSTALQAALSAGVVPVVHGDVAFDQELGGTVASTEEIFAFLARDMAPR